jgi:hypothetical protein
MFGWPVLLAWGIALVLGLGILGFCAYEVLWRLGRLRSHAERLNAVAAQLVALGDEAAAVQQRLTAAREQMRS